MMKPYLKILKEAVMICAIMAVAGIVINAVRPDGLPFVADKPYEIFVPCPETLGAVEMMPVHDARLKDDKTYIIDARTQDAFDAWHYDGAICVTYDYLDPISPEELKNISMNIANSGSARLVVYGDGDGREGTTGYELGRELAGNGIQHVFIVEGGAEALKNAKDGGSHE
ncbi:MAG: rhodanese-like domain-containing protein [Proteobacteria bacterium]|nr:rhodanese-like domain-containing protein [Pseudomonadota bacterium]